MDLLQAIEASALAMWIKESSTIYVAILASHTIGLAFLVGISSILAFRVLGVTESIPIDPFQEFFPLMYAGAAINVFTGVVLLGLYPADYLVDPTIYVKLAAILAAIVILRRLKDALYGVPHTTQVELSGKTRQMAVALLIVWLIATVAGRVMAYSTPTKLQTAAATVIFLAAGIGLIAMFGRRLRLLRDS